MANSLKPHTLDVVDQILAGTLPQEEARRVLHTHDPKSLNPIGFAALSAARDAHSLLELRSLLDPATPEEQGQTELLLEAVQQIGASQVRSEQEQAQVRMALKKARSEIRELKADMQGMRSDMRTMMSLMDRLSSQLPPPKARRTVSASVALPATERQPQPPTVRGSSN